MKITCTRLSWRTKTSWFSRKRSRNSNSSSPNSNLSQKLIVFWIDLRQIETESSGHSKLEAHRKWRSRRDCFTKLTGCRLRRRKSWRRRWRLSKRKWNPMSESICLWRWMSKTTKRNTRKLRVNSILRSNPISRRRMANLAPIVSVAAAADFHSSKMHWRRRERSWFHLRCATKATKTTSWSWTAPLAP